MSGPVEVQCTACKQTGFYRPGERCKYCNKDEKPDSVNHPSHYNAGTLEVIDAIEGLNLGFHAGNVVKYVARYKLKGGVEDLKKAEWYLRRLIELETKGDK